MSSSLKTRLLTAFIGIPIIILVILFPYCHHIGIYLLAQVCTCVGVWEMNSHLLSKKVKMHFTGYLGDLLPLAEYLQFTFFPQINLTIFVLCAALALAFFVEVIKGAEDNFEGSAARISSTVLAICYPGMFMAYLGRFSLAKNPVALTILFLGIVFGSDSLAYFCGMAFGKKHKGIVKCSPNKSLEGFLGGTFLLALVIALITLAFPTYFSSISFIQMYILAFCTAVCGTCGDLFESMLKRACGIKDSGKCIPGRGGMLDCIDSVSVALPVFVLLSELFLN